MINRIQDVVYAIELAKIYNSANLIYPKKKRYNADEDTFIQQIVNDENYLYIKERINIGFMSFHKYDKYVELTSLYVSKENQGMGVGQELLFYFEGMVAKESIIIVKALKDAPWAIKFYLKHGYKPWDNTIKQRIGKNSVIEKPWSMVLYKYI